ncbi:MAG: hypothetical protein H7A23_20600 [Leptospiraceae bacterium]|nr:hypothetical protein [Leptospiraceae bacterium]MCP5496961.1 hypothetical protein [Leptospiraceae bacterium]
MNRFLAFKVFVCFSQFFLLVFYCSNSTKEQLSILPGLNEKYLALNEKFLRDYYGEEETKANALHILNLRCQKKEIKDPHSCYNLAVLHFQSKEYQKAYDASLGAVQKKPTDSLYQNMLRQASLQSNQVYSLSLLKQKNGEIINLYSQMIYHCHKKEEAKVIQNLKVLIAKKYVTSNLIQSGLLAACIQEAEKTKLLQSLTVNKIDYATYYYQEKSKLNPFSKIWDTSYYEKKSAIENMEFLNKELTVNWRDFKRYVLKNNPKFAIYHFKIFLNNLRNLSEKDVQNKNLYQALERAAKIIIEQDKVYVNYRFLIQEF